MFLAIKRILFIQINSNHIAIDFAVEAHFKYFITFGLNRDYVELFKEIVRRRELKQFLLLSDFNRNA